LADYISAKGLKAGDVHPVYKALNTLDYTVGTLAAISVARSVALNLIIRDILLSSGIRKKRENKRLTYRTVKNATILRFENDDTITVGAFINDRV
ncbi:hypothetical protein IC593_18525, partial [Escherichia coli]